ncbi:MAG: type II toxin-antitoxin system RelE/ParE family toxin [Planctomycetaceae bacterium]|nr:type II toxin-antitoxin system RelE/ParE family toxin [Planctomycetaceae bacterium]
MKAIFIESSEFTEWISEYLPDEVYAELQQELMNQPDRGRVIPGCGGLRKIRVANPKRGKGKRSGTRVIYLYVPEARWFFMLDIYDKNEQEKLSVDEKKELSMLAAEFQKKARTAVSRRTQRKR